MFGISKRLLAENLNKLAHFYCAYHREEGKFGLCDCKYLVPPNNRIGFRTEQCGCPEMEQAAAIIGAMTEKEFSRISKRAKVNIVL